MGSKHLVDTAAIVSRRDLIRIRCRKILAQVVSSNRVCLHKAQRFERE